MPANRLVAVGRVGRPHGVRGEVRVEIGPGVAEGMRRYERLYLLPPKADVTKAQDRDPVKIGAWRTHGRFLLMKFEGVETPEQASALSGSTLCVERGALPPLGPGEYYHADLLGCAVRDEAGHLVGEVVDVLPTGAHDVLVISTGGREWMLPLMDETVPAMDLTAGELRVRVPEGLAE